MWVVFMVGFTLVRFFLVTWLMIFFVVGLIVGKVFLLIVFCRLLLMKSCLWWMVGCRTGFGRVVVKEYGEVVLLRGRVVRVLGSVVC